MTGPRHGPHVFVDTRWAQTVERVRSVLCFGHRGAAGHEPENTLRSIETALRMGCDWIEVDVHMVEDQLVVMHDDRLERTTNGTGLLRERSLDYVRSLDAGGGQRVPTLAEVFETIDRRAGLDVELKGPGTAAPVVATVEHFVQPQLRVWSYDQVLITSFDATRLEQARGLNARVPVGLLTGKFTAAEVDTALKLGADAILPSLASVHGDAVMLAHERGLAVFVYTVNEAVDIERMALKGVDGVISDFPDRVCGARGERSR